MYICTYLHVLLWATSAYILLYTVIYRGMHVCKHTYVCIWIIFKFCNGVHVCVCVVATEGGSREEEEV